MNRGTVRAWLVCCALLLGGSAFGQTLVNGGVVRGTISTPGERDTYTFDALKGDWFELRVVDVDGSDFSPQVELYNTRDVLIDTDASPDVAVIDTWKVAGRGTAAPGTYTVVVSNAAGARTQTGAYDVHFVRVPGANAGGELLDGVTVVGEIERGEFDSFTFTAGDGQRVEGTVTSLFGGTLRLRFEEFSASGNSEGIGSTVHFSYTTSPGGVHTIVISDGSDAATGTGRYSILLRGVTTAPPYPPSVFWPSERYDDPLLLDAAGRSGLGPRINDPAEPFNVALDCSAADSPALYALALSTNAPSATSTPFGLLYLQGATTARKIGRHQRSVETWFPVPTGYPLPNDLSLVGSSYTVQGICGGFGGSLRMSGAITETIGN